MSSDVQDQVQEEGQGRQESKGGGALLEGSSTIVSAEGDGGEEEENQDGRRVNHIHLCPAGDAHSLVQRRGQQDNQQQSEEKRCAAHELKEVQHGTRDAHVYGLLLSKGHQGQEHFQDFGDEPGPVQDLVRDHEASGLGVGDGGG